MRKIWTIAWKALFTTFTDRTLIVILIVTPLLISTIIALAFGGGDPEGPTIGEIPVAIVNLDVGLDVTEMAGTGQLANSVLADSLFGLNFGQDEGQVRDGPGSLFNFGSIAVSVLAPEIVPVTETVGTVALPDCTLVSVAAHDAFDMTLESLFAPTLMDEPDAAREAVENGDFVAAVIIPSGFSQRIMPFDAFGIPAEGGQPMAVSTVEVYANAGDPIEAAVVRSVVESVVGQLNRMGVAFLSLADSIGQSLAASDLDLSDTDLRSLPTVDAPVDEWQTWLDSVSDRSPWFAALAGALRQLTIEGDTADGGVDTGQLGDAIGGAIACLFDANAGVISVSRQPLNQLQEQTRFEQVMVQVGSAQAVFFALFTGAFGILGIYEERKQWTLQRMLVSPTSRGSVLGGFLAGNVVVVWAQLALLMLFLSAIASIVLGEPTFIWGIQWPLLLLLTITLSFCVSGLGVLIVGLARTPEQVQVFAPVLNIFLGALGGAFGFFVPASLANLSLITWATGAFRQLAAGHSDIWMNVAVLAIQGVVYFGVGVWFFRRRVEL